MKFTELKLINLEGNEVQLNCAKELGNYIYGETQDLGDLILAQNIYKGEDIEMTEENIEKIRAFLKKGFKAFVQKAFEDTLKQNKNAIESNKC